MKDGCRSRAIGGPGVSAANANAATNPASATVAANTACRAHAAPLSYRAPLCAGEGVAAEALPTPTAPCCSVAISSKSTQ